MGNTTLTAKMLSDAPLAPRFSIITKALDGTTDAEGNPRFHATASSSIIDRAGHQISTKALMAMADKFRDGITIFMDHKNEVRNAFGTTDSAELVQRGVDKTGAAVWDLDIWGPVNKPSPDAMQLHESISGGYVKLGCSIDAFVTAKPIVQKSGSLLIDNLDVFAASIVGVPMNQRSWTQKAVRAVKSFYGEPDTEDDMTDDSDVIGQPIDQVVEKAVDEIVLQPEDIADGLPIPEVAAVEKALDTTDSAALDTQGLCPTCGCTKSGGGDCSDAFHASDTDHDGDAAADTDLDSKSIDSLAPEGGIIMGTTTGGQEAAEDAATPETAPGSEIETDPAEVRKALAFEETDVVALVAHTRMLVKSLTDATQENLTLRKSLSDLTAERDQLAAENDEAKQVIEKVMRMPLRPKTVGIIADFSKSLPDFLAPEVKDFLTKLT